MWTEEVEELVLSALRLGLSRVRAAAYAGIAHDTLCERCRTDEAFSDRCAREESRGEHLHASVIQAIALGEAGGRESGWSARVQAARFYLATRRHGDWRERSEVEHSGTIGLTLAEAMRELVKRSVSEPTEATTE